VPCVPRQNGCSTPFSLRAAIEHLIAQSGLVHAARRVGQLVMLHLRGGVSTGPRKPNSENPAVFLIFPFKPGFCPFLI
jgi:hypothetical protein